MRWDAALAALITLLFFAAPSLLAAEAGPSLLTVCADPNNLPFSNRAGQGFENKIARLIARDLQAHIRYVWWAQRRGYVRNTLQEDKCDLWPGLAAGVERVASTRPYYRSTYVFVSQESQALSHLTLDDPRLKTAVIGIQMIGTDANNTPPAQAVASRGIITNIRGYMLYGNYQESNPPAEIVRAVARGDIDVGLVWGPLAGYFARSSKVKLRIEAITPAHDARWPMQFSIAMGVRAQEADLRQRIDGILERERTQILRILHGYAIPVLPVTG